MSQSFAFRLSVIVLLFVGGVVLYSRFDLVAEPTDPRRTAGEPYELVDFERGTLMAPDVDPARGLADLIDKREELGDISRLVSDAPPTNPRSEDAPWGKDAEWEQLERTRESLQSMIRSRPGEVAADMLFRNVQLNPADTYVPPPIRSELDQIVAVYRPQFAELMQLLSEANATEVTAAVDAGFGTATRPGVRSFDELGEPSQQSVLMRDANGRSALDHLGVADPKSIEYGVLEIRRPSETPKQHGAPRGPRDPEPPSEPLIMHFRNGTAYRVPLEACPTIAAIHEYHSFLSKEFGSFIAMWFERRGLCSEAVTTRILAQL